MAVKTAKDQDFAKEKKADQMQRYKRTKGILLKGYQLGVLPSVEVTITVKYTDVGRIITYRSEDRKDYPSMEELVRCSYKGQLMRRSNQAQSLRLREITDFLNTMNEGMQRSLLEECAGRGNVSLLNLYSEWCCQNHRSSTCRFSGNWMLGVADSSAVEGCMRSRQNVMGSTNQQTIHA